MIIKYYIQFIFLCVPYLINGQQNAFHLADSFYLNGDLQHASLEYERIIFDNFDRYIINEALYKEALTLKQTEHYAKAQNCLNRISLVGIPDTTLFQYLYEKAFIAYLQHDFSYSLSQVVQIQNYVKKANLSRKSKLLEVLILNELIDWQNAKTLFLEIINQTVTDSISKIKMSEKIEDLYSKVPKLLNVKTTKILSFAPGLGHLYAGHFFEGLASFTINLAFLSFGAWQIYEGFYLTGYFIGASGLSEFHMGGMKRAKFLTEKKNYLRIREFNNKAKNELLVSFPEALN